MSTNYYQTFITVAPDNTRTTANVEPRLGTVAAQQLELLLASPYALTSDDLLFEVYVSRLEQPFTDREGLRTLFEAKSKACLRASPLVKTHGWGLHHDTHGRVAAVAIEDPRYASLATDPALKIVPGMRSART